MAQTQNHPEEVGKILVKVHEDLRQLKEQVDLFKISGKDIDTKAIDEALKRTQVGLQKNANFVFNVVSNKVQTLPAIGEHKSSNNHIEGAVQQIGYASIHKQTTTTRLSPGEKKLKQKRSEDRSNVFTIGGSDVQLSEELTMKALFNPENFQNRSVLNRSYGIVLPKIKSGKNKSKIPGQMVSSSIVEPLTILPAANRRDPSLPPPPIDEKDARKGILSLIERGLIPPAAELTLDPSPVHLKRATLHEFEDSTRRDQYLDSNYLGEDNPYMANARFDISRYYPSTSVSGTELETVDDVGISSRPTSQRSEAAKSLKMATESPAPRKPILKETLSVKVYEMPLQLQAAPTEIFEASPTPRVLNKDHFHVKNQKLPDENDQVFSEFKLKHVLHWGAIQTMLDRLITVLKNFAIPSAYVNVNRLVALSLNYELEHYPDRYELISVVDNIDVVTALINTPGRRFMANDGRHIAATKIQSMWRYYKTRKEYQRYRRQRWASALIALAWIMSNRKVKMREKMKENILHRVTQFRVRRKQLAADWETFMKHRRVIVHVPSLSYSIRDRKKVDYFNQVQNAQLGRMFQLLDPNVSIIYVTPVDMEPDLTAYYKKLLGLRGSVEAGQPEKVSNFKKRVTFVHPENAHTFSNHCMSLATLLRYSPKALQRIKNLISGRNAFYLPGLVGHEDVAVAENLDIAILGTEPDVTRLYSSKSGAKRIFQAALVESPPGEYDVYTAQQLHEMLARLICRNPQIKKWILKIDSTFSGRGIAYVDVQRHLPCYGYMLKQVKKFGDKWQFRWAQEEVFSQIMYQLPVVLDRFAQPVDHEVHPRWVNFLDEYLSKGGIIEAYPPTASTCLTVDMFIDPTGRHIEMKSCGDQIHAESPLKCFATTVPQTSIDPSLLSKLCKQIGKACSKRGVVGYFSIDFVTFIDEATMEQKIWSTDLTIAYSDQMALTETILFMTGGKLNASEAHFTIPPPLPEEVKFEKRELEAANEKEKEVFTRYAVMSSKLIHSNLIVLQHDVFFQMCRAHGIGYDIRESKGTIFFLTDVQRREKLGMILIGEDLKEAMESFAANLSIIHQEISSPNMQGISNFKPAIKDIETIVETFEVEDADDE